MITNCERFNRKIMEKERGLWLVKPMHQSALDCKPRLNGEKTAIGSRSNALLGLTQQLGRHEIQRIQRIWNQDLRNKTMGFESLNCCLSVSNSSQHYSGKCSITQRNEQHRIIVLPSTDSQRQSWAKRKLLSTSVIGDRPRRHLKLFWCEDCKHSKAFETETNAS